MVEYSGKKASQNTVMFIWGIIIGFIGLMAYKAHNLVGLIMWIAGILLLAWAMIANIQSLNQTISKLTIANIVLKIIFIGVLIFLMINKNFM